MAIALPASGNLGRFRPATRMEYENCAITLSGLSLCIVANRNPVRGILLDGGGIHEF